ncbi:MAG: non-canonical purine NTP pyrophosphatase [Nitrospirae bacterium]|nr:non-canonical purine NTP pyrophosphatase [Nitrospirota bacterium]
MSLKIVLATKNRGKIEEIKYILKESGIADAIEIYSLSDFPDIPDIVEDGATFSENAWKKAETVAGYTGLTAIADDSGLEVDALNGAPGIYSARFAGEKATDSENIKKLLRLMEGVPKEKRGARFVCVIAVAVHGVTPPPLNPLPQGEGRFGEIPPPLTGDNHNSLPFKGRVRVGMGFFSDANNILMEGECRGVIFEVERGTSGFGYDPVFIIPEYGKTFAELGAEIKNKISHRAVALNKLKTHLKLMI